MMEPWLYVLGLMVGAVAAGLIVAAFQTARRIDAQRKAAGKDVLLLRQLDGLRIELQAAEARANALAQDNDKLRRDASRVGRALRDAGMGRWAARTGAQADDWVGMAEQYLPVLYARSRHKKVVPKA